MGADEALVAQVRSALAAAGNPERAAGQQAYLKSAMPFHGITAPHLRRVVDPLLRAHPPRDRATWESTVRELWDGATHREERYAALALASTRSARGWQDPGVLPLHRHLAVTGAWWDLVDGVATRLVGSVLMTDRDAVTPVMDDWATGEDLWLRRVAILSQLKHREDTDPALLERCVATNLQHSLFGREFFVRKALGWALREHGKTDPVWVHGVLERYRDRLSGLTLREAGRYL